MRQAFAVRVFGRIAGLACFATSAVVGAQPFPLPAPLPPSAVVALAREHRAEILVARARARAAAQRPAIVSALGDPMVMVSADHIPFSLAGVNGSVMIQQDFPLSGVLRHRREAAEAVAQRFAVDTRRVALDVELDALRAYYMLAERRSVVGVLDEQLELARQVVALSAIRVGAAQANQADLLRAQGEFARVEAERDALASESAASEAMLNAALGREVDAPVPSLDTVLPAGEPPPLRAVLSAALAARPEIGIAQAEQAEARAEIRVMQDMYFPMAFVRLGAAYTMADGPGAMAAIGISVPIWRERLRAGVTEARAMSAMADADRAAMARMIEGEAASARADVVAARVRLAALRERVLPLTQQGVVAVLAGYAAGQVPLVAVVDAQRTWLEARMSEAMTDAALGLAWGRLERAMGQFQGDHR